MKSIHIIGFVLFLVLIASVLTVSDYQGKHDRLRLRKLSAIVLIATAVEIRVSSGDTEENAFNIEKPIVLKRLNVLPGEYEIAEAVTFEVVNRYRKNHRKQMDAAVARSRSSRP